MRPATTPQPVSRFIGLDIHKEYLIALGVNADQEIVFGPQRVRWGQFEGWAAKHLRLDDAVVLEMTTNAFTVHDLLVDRVHSVTVVHPLHVKLIVRAKVMTDRKAALALAQLHAAGLLSGIWIPPQDVRDLRGMVAQRYKMQRLATQSKNRLHAVLQTHHITPPTRGKLFDNQNQEWWLGLPLTLAELGVVQSHMETLRFAQGQVEFLERRLAELAAKEERMPLLVQLPGVGLVNGMTILAAIGEIKRFPSTKQLVGYAGLGARVHDSGKTHWTGRITKAGRRDLRRAMIEAALAASRTHPYWKGEMARLAPRIGWAKAIVAIARKLLIGVWHVLTEERADRFAAPEKVAAYFVGYAYRLRVANLPGQQSATAFTREQLDRLEIGQEVTRVRWGSKRLKLPPSRLAGFLTQN